MIFAKTRFSFSERKHIYWSKSGIETSALSPIFSEEGGGGGGCIQASGQSRSLEVVAYQSFNCSETEFWCFDTWSRAHGSLTVMKH